jgi:Tol biopolymer transport system component
MARPFDKQACLFQAAGVFALMGALLLPGAPADAMSATTERASVSSRGAEGDGTSHSAAISADGRFIAFQSAASNLVRHDTNGTYDIFVRDLRLGITRRVSLGSDGTEGNGQSQNPSISGDGRFVTFESSASDLVEGGVAEDDIFVRDLKLGITRRVSLSSDGSEGHGSIGFTADIPPAISADGRFVAFSSTASNLVGHDTNGTYDVFVRDLKLGTTRRVSLSSDDAEGNGASYAPSVSTDGRYVAFNSLASNLVLDDTNGTADAFVRDLKLGTTRRVSLGSNGAEGNGNSFASSISGHGRFVAFYSGASNLVENDTNGAVDVFVRGRLT